MLSQGRTQTQTLMLKITIDSNKHPGQRQNQLGVQEQKKSESRPDHKRETSMRNRKGNRRRENSKNTDYRTDMTEMGVLVMV